MTTVAILAIIATSDPNDKVRWAFITSIVLCLPSLLALLPVFYMSVSTAFNMTGADSGGTTWPVTATYVAVLSLAAVLNVLLVSIIIESRRRPRHPERASPYLPVGVTGGKSPPESRYTAWGWFLGASQMSGV